MGFIDTRKLMLDLSCPKCHSAQTRFNVREGKQHCNKCGYKWEREDLKEKKEEE